MRKVTVVFTGLSGLLIAAHFLRAGIYPVVVLGLALPFLLLSKNRIVSILLQVMLAGAGMEWLRTLVMLAATRRAEGQPWIRMAAILGTVAAFTLATAWMVRVKDKQDQTA